MSQTATVTAKDPPRHSGRRVVVLSAVGGLALLGVTLAFAASARGTPRAAVLDAAPLSVPRAPSAVAEVVSVPVSAPAASVVSSSTTMSRTVGSVPRSRLTAPSTAAPLKVKCAVPYDEIDGIKHWKRECLTEPR